MPLLQLHEAEAALQRLAAESALPYTPGALWHIVLGSCPWCVQVRIVSQKQVLHPRSAYSPEWTIQRRSADSHFIPGRRRQDLADQVNEEWPSTVSSLNPRQLSFTGELQHRQMLHQHPLSDNRCGTRELQDCDCISVLSRPLQRALQGCTAACSCL